MSGSKAVVHLHNGILCSRNNEISEIESRGKNPIYYSDKKNEIPRNKLNQGDKRPRLGKQHTHERK